MYEEASEFCPKFNLLKIKMPWSFVAVNYAWLELYDSNCKTSTCYKHSNQPIKASIHSMSLSIKWSSLSEWWGALQSAIPKDDQWIFSRKLCLPIRYWGNWTLRKLSFVVAKIFMKFHLTFLLEPMKHSS